MTPYEVILFYEESEKLSAACSTSLQKGAAKPKAPRVQWEVEVDDVHEAFDKEFFDFVLHAKLRIADPHRWRNAWGNAHHGEMSLTAHLKGADLRERLLAMKRGQRVRVEGNVTYHARSFNMNPANLVA